MALTSQKALANPSHDAWPHTSRNGSLLYFLLASSVPVALARCSGSGFLGGLLAALLFLDWFTLWADTGARQCNLRSAFKREWLSTFYASRAFQARHVLLQLCLRVRGKSRQSGIGAYHHGRTCNGATDLLTAKKHILHFLPSPESRLPFVLFVFLGYGGPYHPIGLDFWACSYSPTTPQYRRCSLEARLLLHMLRHADRGDAAEAWQPMSSEYKNRLKRSVRL